MSKKEGSALSARPGVWQWRRALASLRGMTMPKALPLLPCLLLLTAADPPPVPGGTLGTVELGRYACEVPDPLDVTRGRIIAGDEFTVVNASSYRTQGIRGSYLRTGNDIVMTSGPREGEKYQWAGRGILQRRGADGTDTHARCVRVGSRKR